MRWQFGIIVKGLNFILLKFKIGPLSILMIFNYLQRLKLISISFNHRLNALILN
jgi:hypothetical protein